MSVIAAGVVLWRPGADAGAVEIAVVHRPKYDDWSLPKGKCEPGEHAAVTAVREAGEESGFSGPLTRALGRVRYPVRGPGGPVEKVVSYWAMPALGGAFSPNSEVDRLEWLPPRVAARQLTRENDGVVLQRFAAAPADTTTVLLVRHGRAGDAKAWKGKDVDRPLDDAGWVQADALAAVGPCFGLTTVVSAELARCVQTVTPLAQALGIAVDQEPALGERQHDNDPKAVVHVLRALASDGGHSAACSQGGVIPAAVNALSRRDTVRPRQSRSRKGSVWALSFAHDRLVAADYLQDLSPCR